MGVDHETGIVHALEVTSANKHDVCMTAELLTGEEQVVYGDSGYLGAEKRPEAITINKSGCLLLQNQSSPISEQAQLQSIQSTDQAQGAREIFRTSQSGTCLCCCKAAAAFPKNTIPRFAKTDRKTEYPVRTCESDSG